MKAQVILVGNLTRDTSAIFSNDDGSSKRALFTVACNSSYKKDGEKTESVDFIPCIAWNGLADTMEEWGLKGRKVHIVGNLESFQKPINEDGSYDPPKIQVRVTFVEFLALEDNAKAKLNEKHSTEDKAPETGPISTEALVTALTKLLSASQG